MFKIKKLVDIPNNTEFTELSHTSYLTCNSECVGGYKQVINKIESLQKLNESVDFELYLDVYIYFFF